MSLAGPHGIKYAAAATELQRFALLQMALLREGLFVYGQANGALTQYDAVKVDNDGQIVQLTTTVSGAEPTAAGATQQSGFSDNYYGWVWRGLGGGSGLGIKVNALTLCATDVKLYTTATAGAIDDSATDCIQGLTLVSTNAAGGTVATECYSSIPCATNSET